MISLIIRFLSALFRVNLIGLAYRLVGIDIGSDFSKNGEKWFVEKTLKKLVRKNPVFLDVGANVGNYSTLLIKEFPSSTIHAFEPNKFTFEQLKGKFPEIPNIILNEFGLSNSEKQKELYYYGNEKTSGHATLYKEFLVQMGGEVEGVESSKMNFSNLDLYIEKNHIDTIDFIKIDTEGHELSILEGGIQSIRKGLIKVIQFEFNVANIESRVFLKDFYTLLGEQYDFFRLKPKELFPLKEYSNGNEIFKIQNIIAINKSLNYS